MNPQTFQVVGTYATLDAFREFVFNQIRGKGIDPDTITIQQKLDELSVRRGDTPETIEMQLRVRTVLNDVHLTVHADRIDVSPTEFLQFEATSESITVLYYRGT